MCKIYLRYDNILLKDMKTLKMQWYNIFMDGNTQNHSFFWSLKIITAFFKKFSKLIEIYMEDQRAKNGQDI